MFEEKYNSKDALILNSISSLNFYYIRFLGVPSAIFSRKTCSQVHIYVHVSILALHSLKTAESGFLSHIILPVATAVLVVHYIALSQNALNEISIQPKTRRFSSVSPSFPFPFYMSSADKKSVNRI